MASFQTKIGWKRPRKREIIVPWKRPRKREIIVPITFYPAHNREFQKNRKKIQKIKKYHYGFFSNQNRLEKAENRENKNYRSVLFLPDG